MGAWLSPKPHLDRVYNISAVVGGFRAKTAQEVTHTEGTHAALTEGESGINRDHLPQDSFDHGPGDRAGHGPPDQAGTGNAAYDIKADTGH